MSNFDITFDINTTDPAANLNIDVFVNNAQVFSKSITGPETFRHTMSDDVGEHELQIVMSGKLPEHTKIDRDGNILEDALITIKNIRFDRLDCGENVTNVGVYMHNVNGTGPDTKTRFYDTIGCNGTVSIKFTTPIYMWILESL